MKEVWGILKKDFPTMGVAQKIGWVIFFPILFAILWFAVNYGAKLEARNKANRKKLARRKTSITSR